MISYDWYSIKPTFGSASQLTRALLDSFVPSDIDFAGGHPVIMYPEGREWSGAPAWGWIKFLLKTRSDWWPSLGIAIQHAIGEHKLAREALASALRETETTWAAQGILEWLVPLADGHDDDLAKVIGEIEVKWDENEEKGIVVDGDLVVRNEADLEAYLRRSAVRAWTLKLWGDILGKPWDTMYFCSYAHRWLLPVIPRVCASFGLRDDATEREIWALLDYLVQEHDLWRHTELLGAWLANPPKWWNDAATVRGKTRPHKPKEWAPFSTLASMVQKAKSTADAQAATPPVLDLAPLF